MMALGDGQVSAVEQLLALGANPNEGGASRADAKREYLPFKYEFDMLSCSATSLLDAFGNFLKKHGGCRMTHEVN